MNSLYIYWWINSSGSFSWWSLWYSTLGIRRYNKSIDILWFSIKAKWKSLCKVIKNPQSTNYIRCLYHMKTEDIEQYPTQLQLQYRYENTSIAWNYITICWFQTYFNTFYIKWIHMDGIPLSILPPTEYDCYDHIIMELISIAGIR